MEAAQSKRKQARHEGAPHDQVDERQRRAQPNEVAKLIAPRRPHHRVGLVPDGRYERRRGGQHHRQDERFVAHLRYRQVGSGDGFITPVNGLYTA